MALEAVPFVLYSSAFCGSKLKLRTAYKFSNNGNAGLGEVEALLYKKYNKDFVHGMKSLSKPIGPFFIEKDLYRKSAIIWQLKEKTPIPDGLICTNIEPSIWVFSPKQAMLYDHYKLLLDKLIFSPVSSKSRQTLGGYDEDVHVGKSFDELSKIDKALINALQHFISITPQMINESKYPEEIMHIENDIARVRAYLRIYTDQSSNFQKFVDSGSFVSTISNSKRVWRPISELFRLCINLFIQCLDRDAKLSKLGNVTQALEKMAISKDLKEFEKSHFKGVVI